MSMPTVQWLAPQPMWAKLVKDVPAISRPEILQFKTDFFMQDFLRQLEVDASALDKFKASPETWRGETPDRLKLYHPAHQRHYLVTASVVCQTTGLPDRTVNISKQESVSFVLRRIASSRPGSSEKEEFALVEQDDGFIWRKVINSSRRSAQTVVPGEQKLALFPVMFKQDQDKRRRLYAGTIPVGQKEIYANSLFDANDSDGTAGQAITSKTARKVHFINQVKAPWENLLESALTLGNMSKDKPFEEAKAYGVDDKIDKAKKEILENPSYKSALVSAREQLQTGSWYILLDFAKFLQEYVPNVWRAITLNSSAGLRAAEKNLYDNLGRIQFDNKLARPDPVLVRFLFFTYKFQPPGMNVLPPNASLLEALKRAAANEQKLESVAQVYDSNVSGVWPNFLYPLADPPGAGSVSRQQPMTLMHNGAPLSLDRLTQLVVSAMPEKAERKVPEMSIAAKLGQQGQREAEDGVYVIRCIFKCAPDCDPFQKNAVSKPTEPFNMAGFFDPDAPARPITITLPEDPTPAGLRKYAKNTALVMSEALCGRVTTMKKVTFIDLVRSVLPWPFHKDLPVKVGDIGPCKNGGKVCALSIPIVTLCAMFLLIMIVLILDYLFRWIPWLMTCFSLEKLIGKRR